MSGLAETIGVEVLADLCEGMPSYKTRGEWHGVRGGEYMCRLWSFIDSDYQWYAFIAVIIPSTGEMTYVSVARVYRNGEPHYIADDSLPIEDIESWTWPRVIIALKHFNAWAIDRMNDGYAFSQGATTASL